MKQYQHLLHQAYHCGESVRDRTGTGCASIFGAQLRFNLAEGFPLLTTKKLHTKSIVEELLWMLAGDTNNNTLRERGVSIWNEWAGKDGELGPIYGKQWRSWNIRNEIAGEPTTYDQITEVINSIKTDPHSRRHIVSAWNVRDLKKMALPPCHCLFQFYVRDGRLSCQLYQRSADIFLGLPFNIASYSLLTCLVAAVCGLGRGEFIHSLGDAHLYDNHRAQAATLLKRTPTDLPSLSLHGITSDLFAIRADNITFTGYDPQPHIAAPVAV